MKKLLAILLLFISFNLILSQKIERIEPANWWVGMKNNSVTLLIYGKDISDLQPAIAYPEVTITENKSVENKNYLFLTLQISPAAKPGTVKIRFSKDKKVVLTKDFPIYAREDSSANRESYGSKDAILLIVPDRFSNGDEKNDIVKTTLEQKIDRNNEDARHGGDIKGIVNHLDYIKSLGYTQIWNTPLIENDEPTYSYHGYAATDFYKIDPRFGTNEDLKKLSSEAKKRNIGLIWDVVLNHCGSEYYFIKDLPEKSWINYPDPENRVRTNHLKTTITDLYATEIDKAEYLNGWFDGHMADLNQKNPLLAKYLTQNIIWWIEYAGLSGLRVDTYSYSDKNFLADWTKAILEEYPKMNIVAEEMSRNLAQTSYWQIDKKNSDGYQSYMPMMMDFSMNDNVVSALNEKSGWFSSWRKVYESVAGDFLFPHPDNQLIFPDNHDLDRFYSRLNKNFENWKLGIAMYMTMRGTPQFFYGTEVLMTNEKAGSDGQRRSDFYGGWKGDSKNAVTEAGLTNEEKEAKKYFTDLLNWRKTNEAVANGKFKHYAPTNNDVYVYFRYTDKMKVMVLLNKNRDKVTLDLNRYKEMIPSKFEAKDIISGKNLSIQNKIDMPAQTAMILEVKN